MARIVPAKPKQPTPEAQALVTVLQGTLPDTHIIFQGIGPRESLLIMAPDHRALLIQFIAGGQGVDMDAREIMTSGSEVDIDRLHGDLKAAVTELGLKDVDFMVLLSDADLDGEAIALGSGMGQGTYVAFDGGSDLEMQKGGETIATINGVLQLVAEGSSEYKPGTITSAQQRWREDLHAGAWSVQSGAENQDASGSDADVEWETPSAEEIPAAEITRPVALRRRHEKITLNERSPRRVTYTEAMVTASVRNIAAGAPIFSAGVEIDPSFVGGSDALLPAVLIAAAENWTPVVVKMGGIGGFDIRLRRDAESLLGFRVADVITSSPTVLFMPVAHLFHSTRVQEEFILDDVVGLYYRWVQKYGLENVELEEIDLKIALRVIEQG